MAQSDGPSWDELVGPFFDEPAVLRRIEIDREELARWVRDHEVLQVVTGDGVDLYPTFQFTDDGVISGLPEVLSIFGGTVDGWTLAGWFRTPDPDLGEPPVDLLRRGAAEELLATARIAAVQLGA